MRNATVAFIIALTLSLTGCTSLGRTALFHPTHRSPTGELLPTTNQDFKLIGFQRQMESPKSVWIFLHGNAGQAENRTYALSCFPADATVFIVEYPGYGIRPGTPSRQSFNQAAEEVYALMRAAYPKTPIGVLGESIGTGPACHLASLPKPPDKIVLAVPFDRLSRVAREHAGSLGASVVGDNDWDNVAALSHYRGPVDIFAAAQDTVIPASHARTLAASVQQAKFTLLAGGHNEWSRQPQVIIQIP